MGYRTESLYRYSLCTPKKRRLWYLRYSFWRRAGTLCAWISSRENLQSRVETGKKNAAQELCVRGYGGAKICRAGRGYGAAKICRAGGRQVVSKRGENLKNLGLGHFHVFLLGKASRPASRQGILDGLFDRLWRLFRRLRPRERQANYSGKQGIQSCPKHAYLSILSLIWDSKSPRVTLQDLNPHPWVKILSC